jgi:Carboxypeptidase regulatory-like domain
MTRRMRVGIAAACAALAAAACDGANAFTGSFGTNGGPNSGGTGNVQGQVTANGAGQGGISVILVNQDSTVTNGAGIFAFDSIPSGTYQIAVRVPLGFTMVAGQTSQRSVAVTNGATSGVNFSLQSTTTVP